MGLPSVSAGEFPFIPISVATGLGLPAVPGIGDYSTWPNASGIVQPSGVPLIVNYEELTTGCRTFENSAFWGHW